MKVTKTETKESTKHSCGYGYHQKDSAEHKGEGGALIGGRTTENNLTNTVTEEKILLQQGAVTEEMLWEDIFKIKCTGKSLVLYITSVRANIIPLRDIGDELDAFLTIAEKKLKPFQIKVGGRYGHRNN